MKAVHHVIATVEGYSIRCDMHPRVLRLDNDAGLRHLVYRNDPDGSRLLVSLLKQQYRDHFGKTLKIRTTSIIAEIWGHVDAEYFAHFLHRKVKKDFTRRLRQFVFNRCRYIDIGEWAVDNNRFIWDLQSFGLPLVRWYRSMFCKRRAS